jgi:hypothetical protein
MKMQVICMIKWPVDIQWATWYCIPQNTRLSKLILFTYGTHTHTHTHMHTHNNMHIHTGILKIIQGIFAIICANEGKKTCK